jgi:hypothetical protein
LTCRRQRSFFFFAPLLLAWLTLIVIISPGFASFGIPTNETQPPERSISTLPIGGAQQNRHLDRFCLAELTAAASNTAAAPPPLTLPPPYFRLNSRIFDYKNPEEKKYNGSSLGNGYRSNGAKAEGDEGK